MKAAVVPDLLMMRSGTMLADDLSLQPANANSLVFRFAVVCTFWWMMQTTCPLIGVQVCGGFHVLVVGDASNRHRDCGTLAATALPQENGGAFARDFPGASNLLHWYSNISTARKASADLTAYMSA